MFTIPGSTKGTDHLICKSSALEPKGSAIRKELEVGQASLVVSSAESTTALNEFETDDLN